MSLLVRALTAFAAVAAAAIGWGIRIFLWAIGVALVIIIGFGVAGKLRRASRDIDQAIALVCDPCHGKPGTCTCTSKAECSHPLCGAADTGVDRTEFDRELAEWLKGDGRG